MSDNDNVTPPEVEDHRYKRSRDEADTAEGQSPGVKAEQDERDDEPEVEGHFFPA